MVGDPEGLGSDPIIPARSFESSIWVPLGKLQDLLSTRDTNYDRRNVFHIDERIEIFRASKIGKMNDVVRYLRDLAAIFLRISSAARHFCRRCPKEG